MVAVHDRSLGSLRVPPFAQSSSAPSPRQPDPKRRGGLALGRMSLAEAGVVAALVLTLLTIFGKVFNGFSWIAGEVRSWRRRNDPAPYPVRLICEDASEFHPSAGFHEGFRIEVHNESDEPVQVKGFGLQLTMQAQGSWERHEAVSGHPHGSFPKWLSPRESFEGYVDAEALADQVFTEGDDRYWSATHAYVDVSGHGRRIIDTTTGQPSGAT